MASPNEKLAASLSVLQNRQGNDRHVFRSEEFTREDRERLVRNGFLRPIVRGWLMLSSPGAGPHETTPWYASSWEFCARYSTHRFGEQWHLAPLQSLLLHAENTTVPQAMIVHTPKGGNNRLELPFGAALFDVKASGMPPAEDLCSRNGVRLFTPEAALVRVAPTFFKDSPVEAQTVLAGVREASGILRRLLAGGHTVVAGRLAGAFRHVGRGAIADEIAGAMRQTEHRFRESNPFLEEGGNAVVPPGARGGSGGSAIDRRLRALWEAAREPILEAFPEAPGRPDNPDSYERYLKHMDGIYVEDAYHSLSIEGYRVTPELLELVRSGTWNPERVEGHRQERNAMAARGYWQASQRVQASVRDILQGAPAGEKFRADHGRWYFQLFQPFVAAGVYEPAALAGYRNQGVFLRGSRHAPPRWELVPEAMQTLFELIENEPEPAIRAAAGHWLFGYIHPYPDGNGRMARFLMNGMLASGGYPWTVIRVEQRQPYMAALESASVKQDLAPYADFMARAVRNSMEWRPAAEAVPKPGPPAPGMEPIP